MMQMKKDGPLIEHRFAKPLLALHAAMDMASFWRASQLVLEAAMPSFFIGAWFQLDPAMPLFVIRNRLPNPTSDWFPDYIDLHPVPPYAAAHPGIRFVRTCDVFPDERDLVRNAFYRRFMKPEGWKYSCGIIFYRRRRIIGVLGICRTCEQGEFVVNEMRLLRELYPHFEIALRRVGRIERERVQRKAFEKFLRRLPLPTLLLDWNLRVIYENHAARQVCGAWLAGLVEPVPVKSRKAIVPAEVLRACERLKAQWLATQPNLPRPSPNGEPIRHPHRRDLGAIVEFHQLSSAAVARPHFLVQFENFAFGSSESNPAYLTRLARLTTRENEIVTLVREGASNQEIADRLGSTLATVKKQLSAIFRKLEVPSRSRLMALLRTWLLVALPEAFGGIETLVEFT